MKRRRDDKTIKDSEGFPIESLRIFFKIFENLTHGRFSGKYATLNLKAQTTLRFKEQYAVKWVPIFYYNRFIGRWYMGSLNRIICWLIRIRSYFVYSFILRKVVHTPLNPAIVIPISILSRISFCPLTYLTSDGNGDDFLRGKHTSSLTSVASFENWERVVVYLNKLQDDT